MLNRPTGHVHVFPCEFSCLNWYLHECVPKSLFTWIPIGGSTDDRFLLSSKPMKAFLTFLFIACNGWNLNSRGHLQLTGGCKNTWPNCAKKLCHSCACRMGLLDSNRLKMNVYFKYTCSSSGLSSLLVRINAVMSMISNVTATGCTQGVVAGTAILVQALLLCQRQCSVALVLEGY